MCPLVSYFLVYFGFELDLLDQVTHWCYPREALNCWLKNPFQERPLCTAGYKTGKGSRSGTWISAQAQPGGPEKAL